jgi:hypothetical protein
MIRWADVKMIRCEDEKMWGWEDVKMWGWEDLMISRCEDETMWRWDYVKMWGGEAVRMWRCEDVKMWRWADVKMIRCEDVRMWRCEDVRMRRSEDEKIWGWEDVNMWGCDDDKMFHRRPLLEEPCAQTLSGTRVSQSNNRISLANLANIGEPTNFGETYLGKQLTTKHNLVLELVGPGLCWCSIPLIEMVPPTTNGGSKISMTFKTIQNPL